MPLRSATRLTDMEFDEVSLVTRPANQGARVVLFKSDVEADMPETKTDQPDLGALREDSSLADVVEYIDTLEKANEELFTALEAAQGEPTEEVEKGDDTEELLKGADPRVVELVKSAEERAVTAETIAKAERESRRAKEFIAKAEELPAIPGDSEALGALMKSAADHLDGETFEAFLDLLAKANAAIEAGVVLDEVGKSTPIEASDSFSAIEKAASGLMNEDPSLTREQAITKAVEADADLYTAHRKEA